MEKKIVVVSCAALVVLLSFCSCVAHSPAGRAAWNLWTGVVQKVDDSTNYKTRKEVEDTCRAMISSYESDKRIYQQYVGSDSEEKRSWAEQAKMRANRIAATYNNYVLKNSFVWSGNVPADILEELPYLE